MAQIFSRRFSLLLRLTLAGAAAAAAAGGVIYRVHARADAPRDDAISQPVPFSHRHHAGDDGIDCRYCHATPATDCCCSSA